MKRILFVMSQLGSGGAERALLNLLCELEGAPYQVDLLLLKKTGMLLDQIPAYVNVLDTPKELRFLESGFGAELFRSFSFQALVCRLWYSIQKKIIKTSTRHANWQRRWSCIKHAVKPLAEKYDVAVGYIQSTPSYYVIDKVEAKKKILWVHTDYEKLGANCAFDASYFARADQVVTVSQGCLDGLVRLFPTLKKRFVYVPNVVSAQEIMRLAKEKYPDEYPDKDTKKSILLSAGRLVPVKGFDMVIQAASILQKSGIDFLWFILGDGPEKTVLEDMIQEFDLSERVILLGLRKNPYPYISNADIVVQSSRYEGKSLLLDEAKILGRPIVTTDYETAVDQIEDGVTGVICPITCEGIADAVVELIKSEPLRIRLTTNLAQFKDDTREHLRMHLQVFS